MSALKRYAKMVKKEGLESDRVKVVDKTPLVTLKRDEKREKDIDNVQRMKVIKDEMSRSWKANESNSVGGSSIRQNDENNDKEKGDSRGTRKNGKRKVKNNPFMRQQRQAEEKAALRAQQQEERRKIQAMIKEKERVREQKRRKFLRQKKPHVGGQISTLLEKIQKSIS